MARSVVDHAGDFSLAVNCAYPTCSRKQTTAATIASRAKCRGQSILDDDAVPDECLAKCLTPAPAYLWFPAGTAKQIVQSKRRRTWPFPPVVEVCRRREMRNRAQ